MSSSVPSVSSSDTVVIPLSKRRLRRNAAGAALFVAVGAILAFATSLGLLARITGAAAVAFFGLALVICIRQLIAMPPGLTLTAEGFVDRGNATALGLVRWTDISRLSVASVNGIPFLVLHVRDQAPYLARGNALQRMTHRANARLVGSPIAIASTTLTITFDELKQLVHTYHAKYGAQHAQPIGAEVATARAIAPRDRS